MRRLVAVALRAGPAYPDLLRRIWDDGDAVLPLDPRAPESHQRALLGAMAAAELVDHRGRHLLDGAVPVREGDAAVVMTSGTTGTPKGVVHTQESMSAAAGITSAALGCSSDSTWLACLPLWHVSGLSVVVRAGVAGCGLVVHDGVDPEAVDAAALRGATHVSLVPTALARVRADLWRRILLGGSSVPDRTPPNVVTSYGTTETFGGVVYDGLPLPGVEVRAAEDPGGESPESPHTSLLEIRSPTMGRCYRVAARGPEGGVEEVPVAEGGWFRTGDLGRVLPDGRIAVRGRADDVIVSGGENVWPEPIERRLEAHPAVLEAAVLGRPDPHWGERVVAVVVLGGGADPPPPEELTAWVREVLPAANVPKEIAFAESLPRSSLGKLARHSLRSDRARPPAGGAGSSGDG